MNTTQNGQIFMKGISGSPGICIGKAYLVDKGGIKLIRMFPVSDELVPKELARFKQAVTKAKNDYAIMLKSIDKDLNDNLNILETHMVLFKDKMLYGKTIETISKEKINAEWALRMVTQQLKTMFKQIEDPYLKARAHDIDQVADKIMICLASTNDKKINKKISDINKRVILVAHDLSPADTSQIQLEMIKGFVMDRGGKDSHTSIIAKSLKLPSVLGLVNATNLVKNDDLLIVDGYAGILIINPDEETILQYQERRAKFDMLNADLAKESHLPAITKDGVIFNLMANIELIEETASAKNYGASDIGLFRTEFLYLDLNRYPTEDELFHKYKKLVELMEPYSVTFRTLDINGDKFNPNLSVIEELNSSLGLRGVRFCLQNEEVFITQLKAILRAAAFGNVNLLIPMISCIDEVIQVKALIRKAIAELKKEKRIFNEYVLLGIMIEVPSAVMVAEHLAEHVDFFSIGTNDLIQYSMAIDRRNAQVAHLYQALNPAVIRLIKKTFEAAKQKGIEVVMCGEMAGDPINIPVLIGIGLSNFSMNPASIPAVRRMIRSMDKNKAEHTLKKTMELKTAKEISDYIIDEYKDILPFHET
jgi:phosphoenolpyruvate-protein phosphotransferase (PTS system enzyme I)